MQKEEKIVRGADLATTGQKIKSYVLEQIADKVSSDDIDNVVELTKAQYDALATKDARTMYIISDSAVDSDHVGIAKFEQTTKSTAPGGTNIWTVTLTNNQTFTLAVMNGNQGNSGYSGAAGELEVVNNLTDGGSTAALSAEMGKTLEGEISQLGQKMDETIDDTFDEVVIPESDNKLDPSLIEPNTYYWGGSKTASSDYNASGFIAVNEGDVVTLQQGGLLASSRTTSNMRFVDTYNEDKIAYGAKAVNQLAFTVPSGVHYVRVSYVTAYTNVCIFINKDSVIDFDVYQASKIERRLKVTSLPTSSEGYIGTEMLVDEAVTIEKAAFFQSKNLLNPDDTDVMIGYYQAGATPTQNSGYNLTGYIKVETGKQYIFSKNGVVFESRFLAKFDNSFNYLSYDANVSSYTPDAGVAYIRLSVYAEFWSVFQVEIGDTPTDFSEYKLVLDPSLVSIPMESPQMCITRKTYNVAGYQNNVYFRNICAFFDDRFQGDVEGWGNHARCARTNGVGGNLTIRVVANGNDYKSVGTVVSSSVQSSPSTNHGSLVINTIGDSFTYNGKWIEQMNTICPGLSFVGMRKPYNVSEQTIRAEGRGGWTLKNYVDNAIMPTYADGFSPFLHPQGYTYYGVTQFWADIVNDNIGTNGYTMNGYDDVKIKFGTNGYLLNPSVNDMMYDSAQSSFVYWNGTAWVNYSGTPTFAFDYAKYIAAWGMTSPDMVIIMLGVNDFYGRYTDTLAGEFNTRMQTVIDSIKAYATSISKTIKIAICTNIVIAGLPDNSLGTSMISKSKALWMARKNIIDTFDSATNESANVFVVDTGATFDPDYGFVTEEVLPFAYYEGSVRELRDTNGVHPSDGGYKQLGTCAAAFMQAVR